VRHPNNLLILIAATLTLQIHANANASEFYLDVKGYPPCSPGNGGDLATTTPPALTVTIDTSDTRQTIVGFGASDCWSIQHLGSWPLAKREAVADLLFESGLDPNMNPRGIALSMWRFNIGAGSSRQNHITRPGRRADTFFNEDFSGYDWTRLPSQRWFLHAAQRRGVELFTAFVNSPPINMTKNGRAFCDSSSGTTNLAPGQEDAFSRYLVDILEHFQNEEGIVFSWISPFNEPQWDWDSGTQEGCRYGIADIKKVVDALTAEMARVDAKIETPESGDIRDLFEYGSQRYLDMLFDSGQPTYVGASVAPSISSHSYFTDSPDAGLVGHRESLRAALDRYPGVEYSMTEYCPLGDYGPGRDLGIDPALYVARVVHFDLTVAEASSWQWWLAVSSYDYKDGLIYMSCRPDNCSHFESKLLWGLGNFSRFVRPGMVRVALNRSDGATASDTTDGLMVSSYYDAGTRVVASVLVNWSSQSTTVKLDIQGPAVSCLIPYVTSSTSDLSAHAALSADDTVEIPARSIVTLVGFEARETTLPPRQPRGRSGLP
jgi:O-glycosyl hydrolase